MTRRRWDKPEKTSRTNTQAFNLANRFHMYIVLAHIWRNLTASDAFEWCRNAPARIIILGCVHRSSCLHNSKRCNEIDKISPLYNIQAALTGVKMCFLKSVQFHVGWLSKKENVLLIYSFFFCIFLGLWMWADVTQAISPLGLLKYFWFWYY